MSNSKSLRDLQVHWYEKLRDAGYVDIENTNHPSRPLKEWHNNKFASKRFQIIQATRAEYQGQIDRFINHPLFEEACKATAKHGNCKFSELQIRLIWELHAEGLTRRKIAKRLRRVKSRIDDVIKRLSEWMMYI